MLGLGTLIDVSVQQIMAYGDVFLLRSYNIINPIHVLYLVQFHLLMVFVDSKYEPLVPVP